MVVAEQGKVQATNKKTDTQAQVDLTTTQMDNQTRLEVEAMKQVGKQEGDISKNKKDERLAKLKKEIGGK